ncbi:MAG: flocculation-associated PEP-CTERM protein PepA [Aquabacterium sp.]|nr:flocculation-associated PEP-CTERM protein PepA [Aquabacterium sp.]
MIKLKSVVSAIGAACLMAIAAPSFATPTLVFKDGANTFSIDPFDGFDWQSNATAVVSPPVFNGTTVLTTSFLASASKIKLEGGGDALNVSGLGVDYEFTVKATIRETVVCVLPVGPVCQIAAFTAVGGSYEIFYDDVADSNILTGTGFVDGLSILTGTIDPGFAGTFALTSATSGAGVFTFNGAVMSTETDNTKAAYFAPALAQSNAASTLQLGGTGTSWTPPSSWTDGGGIPTGSLVFQADGNQTFDPAKVPEPGTLALVGLSLAGLGFARRRIAKK